METQKNELGCVIIKREKEVIKRNTLEKPKKKTKQMIKPFPINI